eukprot:gene19482-biopygen18906
MGAMGIPQVAVRWMQAFLTDRRARVRVGSAVSSFYRMEEGCPQGTISGPVAWDIFVDDVVAAVEAAGGEVSLYADDIAICIRGKRVAELYRRGQKAMDGLHKWAQENGVRVSLKKTSTTLLFPQGAPPAAERHLQYGGQPVKQEYVARLRSLVGPEEGRPPDLYMYLALVQSIADYALPAYAPYVHPDALKSIRRIEKDSAMLVGGTIARSRLKAIYAEADTMPIDRRAELQSARM